MHSEGYERNIAQFKRFSNKQRGAAMSRYYFGLHNGDGPLRDEAGVDIASRTGVLHEVAKIMLGIARDELPTLDRAVISITVRDEEGHSYLQQRGVKFELPPLLPLARSLHRNDNLIF
jgi:hypothetical protein